MNNLPLGLGVGIPSQTLPDPAKAIELLNPEFWYNWGAYWAGRDNSDTYLPMMYRSVGKRLEYYRRAIEAADNAWLLGNEYDMPGQANGVPSAGVKYINEIISMGVTSWIGPNCCLNGRSYGIAWMDEYVRLGGPIPDAWGVHFYGCRTVIEFKARLDAFKAWMYRRGIARPVIVTEVSAEGASVEVQASLMRGISEMLGRGELQAAAWFSAEYGSNSDLIIDGRLTELGRVFVELRGEQRYG